MVQPHVIELAALYYGDLFLWGCAPVISEGYPSHPWFGKPKIRYAHNPARAKELLKQAGDEGRWKSKA
jgi:ABC-type transport system substrate-binding protein